MRLQRLRQARRGWGGGVGLALGACLTLTIAACGSSGSSGSSASPTPSESSMSTSASASASPTASMMPTSGAAAQAAVKADWEEFFNAKTATARRVVLLQNGEQFTKVLAAQATTPLASSLKSQVTKVTITSPTQATVTYTLLVGGNPVLQDKTGVAVYQNGTWKVGVASFCGLLVLQNGGKTSSLPAQCKTSG